MDRPSPNAFRTGGMFFTLLVMIILALAAIRLAYTAGQPMMLG
jgi:hypothetical protein